MAARIKPLPKALAVVAVIGIAGYFLNSWWDSRQANKAAEPAPQAVAPVPAPVTAPVTPAAAPVQVAPAPAAPEPEAKSGGIDAVLKAGKK